MYYNLFGLDQFLLNFVIDLIRDFFFYIIFLNFNIYVYKVYHRDFSFKTGIKISKS